MTAGELLIFLAQALLLLLTAWKGVELAQRRDVARLDVFLLLLSLSVAVLAHGSDAATDGTGLLRHVDVLAAALQPVLLLRLVLHFRRVAGWITGLVAAAVAACWGLILFAPAGWRGAAAVVASLLFAAALTWATRALWLGARHAHGAVRGRMGLLTAGAAAVVVIALARGLAVAVPDWDAVLTTAAQVAALGAACLYALGLAPSPWLARAWQQVELQQFLRAAAGHAGETPDDILQRLCQTSRHAVGGLAATTARWDETRQRLELELRGERALVSGPLAADGLVARQWTFRRPFVADDRSAVREACLRMAPGLDCGALIGVPLITPSRVYGLLLVFLRRGPVLPDEDLRLLSLFAEHSAVFLDHAHLVADLRRELAVLRGEPVPEDDAEGELPIGA